MSKLIYSIRYLIVFAHRRKADLEWWWFHLKAGGKDKVTQEMLGDFLKDKFDFDPYSMFELNNAQYMVKWDMLGQDNDLTYMMRGVAQNRLHETDRSTTKLFEYIYKNKTPLRLFVSLLYTKRLLPDHKFAWIRQTDPAWQELIENARKE